MNAPTLNVVSTRTFSKEAASSYKFIHGKIGAPEWTPTPLLPIPPTILAFSCARRRLARGGLYSC